jgi:hypothetical protein
MWVNGCIPVMSEPLSGHAGIDTAILLQFAPS